ncbi:MAG: hypothetical protein LC723_14905, partial [Actinobacteria bacterium]|nr:hypothetical protein [Actinomycetota bacterium]
ALEYGVPPSTVFSHEVLETFGDPNVDEWVLDRGTDIETPLELCDAVEGDYYEINGVQVSNFLLEPWFGWGSGPRDFLQKTPAPFTVAPRGYMVISNPDGTTDSIMGHNADRAYIRAKSHALGRALRRTQ